MKKRFAKKLMGLVAMLLVVAFVAACAREEGATGGGGSGVVAQGITDDEILVGATFVTAGALAFIGLPIVDAFIAVIERVNAHGGVGGRQIRLIHYNDDNDPIGGRILIERLVEEDQVFALLGLSGVHAPTSLEYLRNFGIPVINITGGIAFMYHEYDPGSNIFLIQPSNEHDGPTMLARALREPLFGPNHNERLPYGATIGLMFSNNDAGFDVNNGVMRLAEELGITDNIIAEVVTPETYFTVIQQMMDAGVDLLLVGSLDTIGITAAMSDAGWYVPVIGAYGTSTIQSHSPEVYHPNRRILATTWAQYITPGAQVMLADMEDALRYHPGIDDDTRASYVDNNFARAGYFMAMTLVVGLERMEASGLEWTWENFISIMESEYFDFYATPPFSFANGRRMGITDLALFEYRAHMGPDGEWVEEQSLAAGFESLDVMVADILEHWGR